MNKTLKKGLVTLALVGAFGLAPLAGNCLRERVRPSTPVSPQAPVEIHQTLQMKTGYYDSVFYGRYNGSFEDYWNEFYSIKE